MRPILIILASLVIWTSCSKDDSPEDNIPNRTVIVYMAAENNLSLYAQKDINEMIKGAKQLNSRDNLILFVDKADAAEKPYIVKITQEGEQRLYEYERDFLCSDPDNMEEVLRRCIQLCPASESYGLVLWGHASGWIIQDSVQNSIYGMPRRAYGVDNGQNQTVVNGKWINIPSMRKVFSSLGIKWKFIFSDCCNMQSIETAYELRNNADYLIASPAEISGNGADYEKIVPAMYLRNDVQMYKSVCDLYNSQVDPKGGHLPISTIMTSQLEALAQATRNILPTVTANVPKDDFGQGHIYYFGVVENDGWTVKYLKNEKAFYDMNDIILWGLTNANMTEAYGTWRAAFDQAVVYSKMSTFWHAQYLEQKSDKTYKDFTVTSENYGGVSMFFPLTKYDNSSFKHNENIKKMSWYYAVGWSELGW